MATTFPNQIDTFINPVSSNPLSSPPHAQQHANANDAIKAVQETLGINPQGDSATVGARIAAIESGGVSGSGVDNQVAIWSGSSTQDGSAALTFNGATLGLTGGITQTGGVVSLSANAASNFATLAGSLTLTSAAAATWSTTVGNLTITGGSALQLAAAAGSEVVINDNSADVDFRVESDTNKHALFVDGETGNVAIGTSNTSSHLLNIGAGSAANLAISSSGHIHTYGALAPLDGQLLIGSTSLGRFEKASLTAGTNITITNESGKITINASGSGSGSVTSVGLNSGSTGLTVTSSTTNPITTSGTFTLGGTLEADNGGTGQSSYAIGDILFANTTSTLSKLADVATGNVLISGGVGVAPSYGKVGLTTHVSGTLPIANGGTGQTTASAAFGALSPLTTKGDLLGYSTANARIPVGTNGQVLTADSTQALGLKWSTLNVVTGSGASPKLAAWTSASSLNGVTPAQAAFNNAFTSWGWHEDFVSDVAGGPWMDAAIVAKGSVAFDTTRFSNGHQGVYLCSTDSAGPPNDAVTIATPALNGLCLSSSSDIYFENLILLDNLSTATHRYTIRCGFGNAATAEFTEGIYAQYDLSVSSNWYFVCANGGTRTLVDTGIPVVADTWYKIQIYGRNSSAHISINNSADLKVTTNTPNGRFGVVGLQYVRTLNTTGTGVARNVYIDYVTVYQEGLTRP